MQGQLDGKYILTVSSKFRVRAAPMQRYITVNFTAKCVGRSCRSFGLLTLRRIDEVLDAEGDDKRRVTSLNETEEIEQAKIHLANIPHGGGQDQAE
jgi:hypothetical protein